MCSDGIVFVPIGCVDDNSNYDNCIDCKIAQYCNDAEREKHALTLLYMRKRGKNYDDKQAKLS